MDRPRSPVQDAGRWVRSIPPLGCSPLAKHEERGRLPSLGETAPLFVAYSIVSSGPPSRPGCRCATLRAAGFGLLPPVHRLLQPARGGEEFTIIVVAVYHLLDVV